MVLQILSHARQIACDGNPQLDQVSRRPDARQHQELRRIDGAATQENFALAANDMALSAATVRDGDGASSLDHYALDEAVGFDSQIRSGASRVEIRDGSAATTACVLRDLVVPDSFLLCAVEVVVRRQSGVHTGRSTGSDTGVEITPSHWPGPYRTAMSNSSRVRSTSRIVVMNSRSISGNLSRKTCSRGTMNCDANDAVVEIRTTLERGERREYRAKASDSVEKAGAIARELSAPELKVTNAYSIKTNPDERLIRLALESGFLAETISLLEVKKALEVGFKPEQIVLNGPAKWWRHAQLPKGRFYSIFCV